jgi:hypothetical protein
LKPGGTEEQELAAKSENVERDINKIAEMAEELEKSKEELEKS